MSPDTSRRFARSDRVRTRGRRQSRHSLNPVTGGRHGVNSWPQQEVTSTRTSVTVRRNPYIMCSTPTMSFPQARHCVRIIKEGLLQQNGDQAKASAPVVLVHGVHNVLIGTGLPSDRDLLLQGLEEYGVRPEQVEYVVCSHGAVEECGNLNLFVRATHIVGYNIVRGDSRILHDFTQDIPYEIDDEIEVLPTPGFREGGVVSIVVSSTPIGTVAIAGGVFHSEGDLENPDLWVDESCDAEDQQQSRITLLKMADHVVPRYGPLFQIPDSYRGSGMPVIQTP